jgi:type III secretory pathway component EscT
MLGVVFSALFTTVEYRRLGQAFGKERKALVISYRFKQIIVCVEIALSVAFGVTMYRKLNDAAAVLEWCK